MAMYLIRWKITVPNFTADGKALEKVSMHIARHLTKNRGLNTNATRNYHLRFRNIQEIRPYSRVVPPKGVRDDVCNRIHFYASVQRI
jgi:hypothetical protein